MIRWRAALFVASLAVATEARADLFSPGELAKAHESLRGLSECTSCHPAGGQLSQGTCLSCHVELQVKAGKGLHGLIPDDKRDCESCHREHQGADAHLIDWGAGGEKGFNHQRTGWTLKGAHAKEKCVACHEKRRIVRQSVLNLLEKRPATRLGLSTGCPDCHFDEHRGQLQADCDYCHTEKEWKPAPKFGHASTAYPLQGKHKQVKCGACHPQGSDPEAHGFPAPKSETYLRMAPVEHRTCLDCHKDVHEGRFGLRCQSCHTVAGWSLLRTVTKEREFHERTKFPLRGAHHDVDCVACHGPFPGQKATFKGLAFETCAACHADAHVGQFTAVGGKLPDCSACHSELGFSPPQYGLKEHAQTRYPLEGAHQVVPCGACHEQSTAVREKVSKALLVSLKRKKREAFFSSAVFDYSKPLDRCESCHDDVHEGQFKDTTCDTCHQFSSFLTVRFDHQKDSRFPLKGAHQKVACDKCHLATQPKGPVRFKLLEVACRGCHLDVHVGQFSKPAEPVVCERCHDGTSWKKLLFQHAPPFTQFLLDGKHAQAKCEACHRRVTVAQGVAVSQYRPLPNACEGCHADFHQGTFKGFEP